MKVRLDVTVGQITLRLRPLVFPIASKVIASATLAVSHWGLFVRPSFGLRWNPMRANAVTGPRELRKPNKRRAPGEERSFAADSRTISWIEKYTQKIMQAENALALMPEAHASPKTHKLTYGEQVQMRTAATKNHGSHSAHSAHTQRYKNRSVFLSYLVPDCTAPCRMHNRLHN
jgi:hypothetical protein